MSSQKKLSLIAAIFVNLNVMIGAGLFINTYTLSTTAGAAGFLLYPLVGICMFPLISVIGQLLGHYPTGGFYAFAKDDSPYLGFVSCWSYFFGKLASVSVMLTVGATMLQKIIPGAICLSVTSICLIILTFFTLLNLQNMKVGIFVQSLFLASKSIPIIFAIIAGILLYDTSTITTNEYIWSGMIINIPLVLYCLAGFETACALGRNIENPSVNGPKAIYYSFGIIMILYAIFQGCIYMNIHDLLPAISDYLGIFSSIAYKICNPNLLAQKISFIVHFAIGSSALGGAYAILFANSWNLYTLAEHNHIFNSSTVMQLNKHNTPWVAIIIESCICTIFLLSNNGSLVSLQRTATLGIVIAYTISTLAYFKLLKKIGATGHKLVISSAAFITCTLFVWSCIHSFIETGINPLFLFIGILTAGSIMFIITKN
jgi:amino acid transporter